MTMQTATHIQSKLALHRFDNFAALSDTIIQNCLSVIDQSALAGTNTYFALAGGSTPAPLYRALDQKLATRPSNLKSSINFIATDERWVADSDAQSNEGLFKQCMPHSYHKNWNLISLKNSANTPEVAVEEISARINHQIPNSFNAIILGMGTDGHIASLFPNAPIQNEDHACIAAIHPQNKQTRMSLSLPRLLKSNKIYLVITGEEKLKVLESAFESQLPISELLRQATSKIDVFWCP